MPPRRLHRLPWRGRGERRRLGGGGALIEYDGPWLPDQCGRSVAEPRVFFCAGALVERFQHVRFEDLVADQGRAAVASWTAPPLRLPSRGEFTPVTHTLCPLCGGTLRELTRHPDCSRCGKLPPQA